MGEGCGEAGRVSLGAPVGGIPELIRDGVNGLLVTPGDARLIAEAIIKTLSSEELRARMSASKVELAQARHDAGSAVRTLCECYRDVTTGSLSTQ